MKKKNNNLKNKSTKETININNEKISQNKSQMNNQNQSQNKKNYNLKENNEKKSIFFYHNNTKQTIKYYGKFNPISTKKILKDRFFIEEEIDQIFFQDKDGDILILNSNIPNNITVYLYIQKDLIPKNPSKTLKISNNIKLEKPLLKFHWILENEDKNRKYEDAIVNKYIYKNTKYDECHPSARSSVTFTTGVHFFVIRVGTFDSYECLRVVDDDSPDINDEWNYNHNTLIGFSCNLDIPHKYGDSVDIGILIDMEKKICAFYNYEKKEIINRGYSYYPKEYIPMIGKIKSDAVKIIAWLKRGHYYEKEGMTILNEGCIPIPNWVKKINDNIFISN